MGAHFIEQDVVASRDDELVVLHDIHLDRVTDVAERHPGRAREDGRFYVRDFDLGELKLLRVHERRGSDGSTPAFPGRFPDRGGDFRIATLREEIELVQGLNRSTGRHAGIYPEVKRPAWHKAEGVDVSPLLLQTLAEFGYVDRDDAAFVQCFDATETRRLREDLGCKLRLVQLIGENDWGESATDYNLLKTSEGLDSVATYADGIGPWMGQLYTLADIDGEPVSTGLVAAAHGRGLTVHPYTFRADQLGPGFDSFPEMVAWFAGTLRVDGLFTDFPDLALAALQP